MGIHQEFSSDPSLYSHFDLIWRVHKNHMVIGLPLTSFLYSAATKSNALIYAVKVVNRVTHLLGTLVVHRYPTLHFLYLTRNAHGEALVVLLAGVFVQATT